MSFLYYTVGGFGGVFGPAYFLDKVGHTSLLRYSQGDSKRVSGRVLAEHPATQTSHLGRHRHLGVNSCHLCANNKIA
jgi:hypothetical protein